MGGWVGTFHNNCNFKPNHLVSYTHSTSKHSALYAFVSLIDVTVYMRNYTTEPCLSVYVAYGVSVLWPWYVFQYQKHIVCYTISLSDLITILSACFIKYVILTTTYIIDIPGSNLVGFTHKKNIICNSHNTSPYWECEGPTSPVPMQPTNKELRISYVHEVNNSRTQLLSMSHTTN